MEVITTHINADFDSLASMLAARKLYPGATIIFPGSQEKSVRDFLVKSTFYAFEAGEIKGLDFNEIERLILVDIRQSARIGKFSEVVTRPDVDIHIYDHHPSSPEDLHGSVEVTTSYGSTTTIMTHILKEREIEITSDEATIMMLGIYEDTGSLTFTSTTVKDYEAASFLLSKGANLNVVSDMLTKEMTAEQVYLLSELIQSATVYNVNGIDVVIAQAVASEYSEDLAVLVHKMRDIENLDVLFAIIMMEDRIHFIARSRIKEVDVGQIARYFGGGGHPTAASSTIKNMTLIQVKEKLIGLLTENITSVIMAKDIMTFPMLSIPVDSFLEDARDSLVRYAINVIPVMKGDMIVGLLSRQVVEKALYHGLSNIGVGEYMTKDFSVVTPDTPLSEVQTKIIEGNQRLLPVMRNDRIKGVITRTDLLRSLHESLLEKPHYISGEVPSLKQLRSVRKMLTERLPNKVNRFLKEIGLVAETLGFKAYLVGGAVRDLILRNKNLDIDIVIEGDGIIFAKKFSETFPCKIRSHQRFGTAVMIFPDGFKIDVATTRLEYYEKPGALPTVELSSIKLDLYRRDFSINTLAVRLNPDGYGELLDFYGGLKDIKSKTIRVLHNLSFVEDPTRILRALRFEQKFGFTIGKQTQSLIKSTVKLNLFKSVAGGRFLTELIYILQEEDFITTLKRMSVFGLLGAIHPEISLGKAEEIVLYKARDVLSWYHLLFLEDSVEEWLVIFLILTTSLDHKELSRLVKKLDVEGKHRKEIIAGREKANKALKFISGRTETLSKSDLFHLLKSFPLELIIYMMIKTGHELSEKLISNFVTKLRGYKIDLTGKALKKMGVPEGPMCGEILRNLLNKKINGELKDIDQETNYVLDFLKNQVKIPEKSKA